MEEGIFPRPAVASALNKMVEARLHYDAYDKVQRAKIVKYQREVAQTVATPLYLIVDPKTGAILRRHFSLASEEEFVKFLEGRP